MNRYLTILFLVAMSCSHSDVPGQAVAAATKCQDTFPGEHNGDSNYCTASCQCILGQADCDGPTGCVAPLECGPAMSGQKYGLTGNACVPAHCKNNQLDALEGETATDCGGDCGVLGPCAPLGAGGAGSGGAGSGGVDAGNDASDGAVDSGPDAPDGDAGPCTDGLLNGTETDVDCGGGSCGSCALGYQCLTTSDCGTIPNCDEADCQANCIKGICNPIKHVILLVQENRSLCHYFTTFPGVTDCALDRCVPDTRSPTGTACPYLTTSANGPGGPHNHQHAVDDINGGAMDGFCSEAEVNQVGCCNASDPCHQNIDVLSYYDDSMLGNYHAYAAWGVLHNRMFASDTAATLPEHLAIFSVWPASCTTHNDPSTCVTDILFNADPADRIYAQTSLGWLLGSRGVSWRYFTARTKTFPSCSVAGEECPPPAGSSCPFKPQLNTMVAHHFDDVTEIGQVSFADAPFDDFFSMAHAGTLPSVSWLAAPSQCFGEHPPRSVLIGQKYVTGVLNTIGNSPNWWTTAVFVYWDDWGGYWDWAVPPEVDGRGYGLRVPSFVFSPYVRAGVVDHDVHSFDSHARFIQDIFVDGQRIDATCGRPDPRPNVRENLGQVELDGNFDWKQAPRAPLHLTQ